VKRTSNVKVYLGENYTRYQKEVDRLLEHINQKAQGEPGTSFQLKQLLEEADLFLMDDKYVYSNYWSYANKQLNMLVRFHALVKQKKKGVNRYTTRSIAEIREAYKRHKLFPFSHSVPHIFQRRYWDQVRYHHSEEDT